MTVADLILELSCQPQNLEVSIVDDSKSKFKEHRDIAVSFCSPELADNYVMILFNLKSKPLNS